MINGNNDTNPIPRNGREEMISLIMQDIEKNNYFKPEKLSKLQKYISEMVKEGFYSDPFDYDKVLSLNEKKASGLNTRKKISKEFFDFIAPAGLSVPEPENLLMKIFYRYFFIICRKYDLVRMKNEGVTKVKIAGSAEQVCNSMDLNKIWSINEVPSLPLSGCTNFYCPCSYIEAP